MYHGVCVILERLINTSFSQSEDKILVSITCSEEIDEGNDGLLVCLLPLRSTLKIRKEQ